MARFPRRKFVSNSPRALEVSVPTGGLAIPAVNGENVVEPVSRPNPAPKVGKFVVPDAIVVAGGWTAPERSPRNVGGKVEDENGLIELCACGLGVRTCAWYGI